jgi:hypothetical protein
MLIEVKELSHTGFFWQNTNKITESDRACYQTGSVNLMMLCIWDNGSSFDFGHNQSNSESTQTRQNLKMEM